MPVGGHKQYPAPIEHEMAIVRQEKHRFELEPGTPTVVVPAFMEELVAEVTHLARRSPEISQRSGVSVRVSVANAEVLEAAALKRAVRLGEPVAAPRWQPASRSSRSTVVPKHPSVGSRAVTDARAA